MTTTRGTGDRGVAIIMTGLLLLPLMVFAAFGVDLASWYARISYIQKSADAASLAGTVWMPNLAAATNVACASLAKNGISCTDTTDNLEVSIDRGANSTSLRVEITDTDATRYFSQVFRGKQTLTRHAEAEYNLPVPLGSPLNYFGGDHTKTDPTPSFSYSVEWPTDYKTRPPANQPCNVGTSSAQGLGSWSSGSPPTYAARGYTSGNPQCDWTVVGVRSGRPDDSLPPPDYTTRPPRNPTCWVSTDGRTTGAAIGQWNAGSPPTFVSLTSGTPPMCTWEAYATDPASIPSFAGVQPPTNRPCRVGYETSGQGGGFWPTPPGGFLPSSTGGGNATSGNRLCRWTASVLTTDTTPPNPIDPARSPGFWAQIHGPSANQQSGDAYSTRCLMTANCGTIENSLYSSSSNPNQGYWYVVKVPPGGGGQTTLRVFDAQLNTSGTTSTGAGDSSIVSGMNFDTTYRVYRQNNPLDFTDRTPVTSGSPDQTLGSCNWSLRNEAAFKLRWVDLCTLNTTPGEIYLINVRTAAFNSNSAGRNGYALEACLSSSCTVGTQPALYAFERMVMYNNIASGDATFYIAEVGPQYAGKTLVLELFDPGESSGQAWLYPRRPSSTLTGPADPVPIGDCAFTSTKSGYPRAADLNNGGVCSVRSSDGGALYNKEWLTMRITIPSNYTCTPGINPETTPGSCWWGMRYSFSGGGAPTDTTTWQARIEGNPIHLTQ